MIFYSKIVYFRIILEKIIFNLIHIYICHADKKTMDAEMNLPRPPTPADPNESTNEKTIDAELDLPHRTTPAVPPKSKKNNQETVTGI